jgi:hypothetical protein
MSVTEQDPETTPIFAALAEEFGLEKLFDESPDEDTADTARGAHAEEPGA